MNCRLPMPITIRPASATGACRISAYRATRRILKLPSRFGWPDRARLILSIARSGYALALMQMNCALQGEMPVRGIQVGRHDDIAVRDKLNGIVPDLQQPVLDFRGGEPVELGRVRRRIKVARVGTEGWVEAEIVGIGPADQGRHGLTRGGILPFGREVDLVV